MDRRQFGKVVSVGALAGAWSAAFGDAFPMRSIHIVVPSSVGGVLDARMRLLGERLSEALRQPVVIDNRPGAAGALGASVVAAAKPDGYTLLMGHSGTHSFVPYMHAKAPYDPVSDFSPVALTNFAAHYLYVRADSPFRSVRDLIAAAKASPGTLTYGTTGVGSPSHIETELFRHMAGIDLVHVPYKGSPQALTDLLGGAITLAFDPFIPGMEHVKAGKLRMLGSTRARRSRHFPDVPTIAESGVPGFEMRYWVGIFAPAGIPKEIAIRLNAAFIRVLARTDVATQLRETDAESEPLTPDQFGALVREEAVKGKRVVEISGAKLD